MRLAAGIFVAAVAAVPGHAQDAAIEGVISSQIEAFRHDDLYPRAQPMTLLIHG